MGTIHKLIQKELVVSGAMGEVSLSEALEGSNVQISPSFWIRRSGHGCWKRNFREKLTAHKRFNPTMLLEASVGACCVEFLFVFFLFVK